MVQVSSSPEMYRHSIYHSPELFPTRLRGRKDIMSVLQRLDKLSTEEARMAAAEALNTSHDVGDKVMDVDHKMHGN
jgi:hypothetical protein